MPTCPVCDDLALNALMDRWQAPLRGFLYRACQLLRKSLAKHLE